MSWYKDYKLVQNGADFIVEIYLNPSDAEFSGEFLENVRENVLQLDDEVNKFINENFSQIKINTVKLILGAVVIATIPFIPHEKAHAAETTSPYVQQIGGHTYTISRLSTTGTVLADVLNMRTGPSTEFSIMHRLWQGNVVKVIGETNGWYEVQLSDGRVGWVSKSYLKLNVTSRQQRINTLIYTAKSFIGTPYVWGGSSLQNGGFDCSGFTQYVFKQVGYNLNRVSRDQAAQGTYVSRYELQPGDLVFYSLSGDGSISHVGIYIGNGQMIHSPKTGDTVKITDITTSYWESHYITARRIIQ